MKQKFYFTYGTSERMPFIGGWTVVIAQDYAQAIAIFRAVHPDISEGVINCAFIYSAEEFESSEMFKNNSNLGSGCREILSISRELL